MESQTMKPRHRLKKLIRGWLPEEPKTPSRGLYQPMFKGWTGSLLTGIDAALIVLGLSFCFSSSFYVDGYLPAAAVLDVIGHYLEGIAIGCAFLASGVILVVFGIKKSQNNYFTPQIRASENLIEGWLPKEPSLPSNKAHAAAAKNNSPKPNWWKPLWIVTDALVFIFVAVNYFVFHYPLSSVVSGLAIALLGIGAAYYVRVRPSVKVNRTLYILLGITPIGFSMWMVLAFSGVWRLLNDNVGAFPSLIIGWVMCLGIGGLIGDWIGKRRNYQLPLSP
jgi:hypothetical protein